MLNCPARVSRAVLYVLLAVKCDLDIIGCDFFAGLREGQYGARFSWRLGVTELARSKGWRKMLTPSDCFEVVDRNGAVSHALSSDSRIAGSGLPLLLPSAKEAICIRHMICSLARPPFRGIIWPRFERRRSLWLFAFPFAT